MKNRILIIGRQGQVGWELCRTLAPLGEVVAVDFPELDLSDAESTRRWVRTTSPRLVVNAAAYTAVDQAETDAARCRQINGVAPGILAEEAERAGAWLVHYSTDYVFDGRKREPYLEEDSPNPLSAYGAAKLEGDLAVRKACERHLIFRLCWVYGARGKNFLLTMARLARERETLRVVSDQAGAPTWSRMIAEATAQAVGQVWRDDRPEGRAGTYHLAAAGMTSWHGFAEAIIRSLPEKKCRELEAIPTSAYPLPAKRPAYSVLSGEKLARVFGLRLPDWRHSLEQALENLHL